MLTLHYPTRCVIGEFDISAKYAAFHANSDRSGSEAAMHDAWHIVSRFIAYNVIVMRAFSRARARKYLTAQQLEFFNSAWPLEVSNQDPLLADFIEYAARHFLHGRPNWTTWVERELAHFADRLDELYEVCLNDN